MKFKHLMLATGIACATMAAHAQDPAQDSDLARNLAATCANCHGTNGHSQGGTESLAGEPQEKLLRKLDAFATGEKPATIMHQIAKGYTKAQLEMITHYFSMQK